MASQEGLSGGIGDGGHAYGPFQLNNAGGVISNLYGGRVNDPQVQAWAQSPAGINFALDHIAQVAKGLRGQQAVNAIVSRFERPANIPREIAGANAAYGRYGGGALPPPVAPGAPPALPTPRRQGLSPDVLALLNQGNRMFGLPELPAMALGSAPTRQPTAAGLPSPSRVGAPPPPSPLGQRIAKTALSQIGIPYQWGGQAKLGSRTDCSGLLQASAAANGVQIGRTTYQQWKQGTPVPLNALKPGDAVFFDMGPQGPGHVAIYIGGGRVVEDPHTGATVEVSTLAGRGPVGARRYA